MTSWTTRPYAYDNDSAEATAHHEALASLLDPVTRWRITDLLDLTGAHCLEVGAGAGSVALWLADRVGPDGSVVATDTKPGLIPDHPRLTVLEHDITSQVPPGGDYDLVHARLLLNHLPQRRQVLERLAEVVAPGGVLLTEDFWPTSPHEIVAHATSEDDATLLRRFHLAHLRTLSEHGSDRGWSRRALLAFMEEGLTDVRSVAYGGTWRGGSPGCQLLIAGTEQLREHLLAAGLTCDELDRAHELLRTPGIVLHGHMLYSTSGRRPSTVDGAR
ncbi:class I SAM-dependent methyltransferase [Rugosimonospora africana]|uniref:Methyltransferase n=1 Tax=Rugosimonospora africana TaxID=556532 RepID=A0A8J3QMS1_9ACTN|nr:class I SAM-dependent methyltransferase [Rugosimonospora africana]GIH12575.1 methyltransferase [Rugosimonospora africana]